MSDPIFWSHTQPSSNIPSFSINNGDSGRIVYAAFQFFMSMFTLGSLTLFIYGLVKKSKQPVNRFKTLNTNKKNKSFHTL